MLTLYCSVVQGMYEPDTYITVYIVSSTQYWQI